MSQRRVQVVILCEDRKHEQFIRRLCDRIGHRWVRSETAPGGKGSAENWVRRRYPGEVRAYRSQANHLSNGLVAAVDGDRFGVAARKAGLDAELVAAGQQQRGDEERVAVIVPTWSVETWLAWLCGHTSVVESQPYKRDSWYCGEERRGTITVKGAADGWFASMGGGPPELPSLVDGRKEVARLKPPK